MKRIAILAGLLALCAGPALAQEKDCTLKLVNTIPLTMAANGLRALVPVTINGSQERLLLDTGGIATQLSLAAIEKLKLTINESSIKMLDLYGNAASGFVRIDSFVLGQLQDRHGELLVSPFRFGGDSPVAGILAADYMAKYDLEFDFADSKLNYLSPQHCPGKVVYWPAAAVAVVPMRFVNNHLRIEVLLDGKPFRAIIDTGAPGTTLTAGDARRVFGITEESPDVRVLGGDEGEKRLEKVFDTLTFDGISIGHPHITIIPDLIGKHDVNNSYVTGSRTKRVDDRDPTDPTMLIGMNILTKLRFVVAFSEDKIYLTPATPPAAAGGATAH